MESLYYSNTTLWVLLVDVLVALSTLWLFWQGKASKRSLWVVAFVFVSAIAGMYWLFGNQLLPVDTAGSTFFLVILAGAAAIVALLEWLAAPVMRNLGQVQLQLVQGLRVFVGGGFLMEGVVGVIPQAFSILDGFFHIASGFLALVAAIALLMQYKKAKLLLWIANMIGLLDIMVIVSSICFWVWDDLGPHHNMHYVVFGAGPILLWIHFNSIKKLIRM